MNRIFDRQICIEKSASIIGFDTIGGGNWSEWDRYLTIAGKHAYHMGNICGTCQFFFERLNGANKSIAAAKQRGKKNSLWNYLSVNPF